MAEKIIVAVDGGRGSDAAIRWVVHRAAVVDCEIEVTTVARLEWSRPGGAEVEHRTPPEEAVHRAVAAIARAGGEAVVTTSVRHGDVVEELIVASAHADQLVLGAARGSLAADTLSATIPLRVAGRALCPTVIVPIDWTDNPGVVLVGWEDTAAAERAVDAAAQEAMKLHRSLAILYAWEWRGSPTAVTAVSAADLRYHAIAHAHMLAEVAHRIRRAHPRLLVAEHLVRSAPSEALVAAAARSCAVFVGSAGEGVLSAVHIGSTGHDLVVTAPVPVVVVGAPRPAIVLPDVESSGVLS